MHRSSDQVETWRRKGESPGHTGATKLLGLVYHFPNTHTYTDGNTLANTHSYRRVKDEERKGENYMQRIGNRKKYRRREAT